MAADNELIAKLTRVVDLAVEHNADGAVFVPHRLAAARRVDDNETLVAKPHTEATINVNPCTIRPSMPKCPGHGAKVSLAAVARKSSNSAHFTYTLTNSRTA